MPAAEIENKLNACMEYELRDKDGKLKSVGKQFIDRHGRTHLVQKDGQGKLIGEVILNKDGSVKEIFEGDSSDKSAISSLVDTFKKALKIN